MDGRKDSGTREINLPMDWYEDNYNTGVCFCQMIPIHIPKGKCCLMCPKVKEHVVLKELEVQDANT